MTEISKTTITLTVLHYSDEPLSPSLEWVLEEIDTGNAVGWETGRVTVAVPADAVRGELLALGNDGEFFNEDVDGPTENWESHWDQDTHAKKT